MSLYSRGSAGIGQAAEKQTEHHAVKIEGVWVGGAFIAGGLVVAALIRSYATTARLGRMFGPKSPNGRGLRLVP